MMFSPVPAILERVASDFWQPLLAYKVFPVDFDRVVAFSNLSIFIIQLPDLTLKAVQEWVSRNNHPVRISADNRPLHGFLLAHKGIGTVFVNGTDPLEERRYTVAHEVSHFLLDYQIPRQNWIDAVGPAIIEVLDGEREPSLSERLQFITADLPSPFSIRHLSNGDLTAYDSHLVWRAEQRVDALAVELLAPFKEVMRQIPIQESARSGFYVDYLLSLLSVTFGLPASVCYPYAKYIDQFITGGETLAEEWGLCN